MQIANWPAFIASRAAALKSVMIDEGARRKPMYPMFMKVESLDGNREERRTVTGIGMMQKVIGEKPSNIPVQEMVPRYSKVFTYNWYATRMEYTKPFLMDEVDRFGAQYARQIPAAGRNIEEWECVRLFYGMTDATNYPIASGKALAANDHDLYTNDVGGAVTFDNYVNATLDHDTLVDAMVIGDSFVDDRGYPISMPMNTLICVQANYPDAIEILTSQLRSDTTDNTTNIHKSEYNLTPVRWHWLGALSTTFWALQGPDHSITFKRRQGIQTDVDRNFDDYSLTCKGDTMFGTGIVDFRGFVGGSL